MLKIGPKYKIARRLGAIFEKTQTPKFALRQQQRMAGPGSRRPRQGSEYSKQLLEKQKLRLTYGLKEKHLANYVKEALSSKQETVATLYQLLERRLDSVVFRAGLADTRRMARQLVSHGHVTYNGRKVTIPSIQVKTGDSIAVREGSRDSVLFNEFATKKKDYKAPAWMELDLKNLSLSITSLPESSLYDFDLKKIIEYYTR